MEPESTKFRKQHPVGDNCKNMERTSPSKSFSDLHTTLDERFAEQRHRDLWLFLYSSRHTHLQLWQAPGSNDLDLDLEESNQLLDDTFLLLEKFSPSEPWQPLPTSEQLAAELNEFCFGITYAFHRRQLEDGFIDIRFEEQLARYDAFINQLNDDEMTVVSQLHGLTYKYGFVITELWNSLIDSSKLIDAFIIKNLGMNEIAKIPSFVFPKKGSHPRGIQILTKESQAKISEPWDLVVFIDGSEKLSNIKEKISNSWKGSGDQVIGDQNQYKVAFYVDRDQSNIRNLIDIIKLQADHLNDYTKGLSVRAEAEELASFEKNNNKKNKELKRNLASTVDRLRLSEGLILKRWSTKKSNIRRSIGLYLWDQKNITGTSKSRKKIIIELIDEIKNKRPEIIEFYLKKFNEDDVSKQPTKYGDSASALETVMREMEADFDLTARCIQDCEYLTPHDVKAGSRIN